MATQVQDGQGVLRNLSTTVDNAGNIVGSTCITDPSASGAKAFVNAPGALLVSTDGGSKATYRYYSAGNTPAATPTDVFTITGSATKTIRIKHIKLTGSAGTAGQFVWYLVRRSGANTGGTSTAPTPLKHDSSDAAATAALALYTANPTGLGTTVGNISGVRLFHNVTTAAPDRFIWDFSTRNDKALVLRGTGDVLAINGNGAALPTGAVLDITVEFEEDAS